MFATYVESNDGVEKCIIIFSGVTPKFRFRKEIFKAPPLYLVKYQRIHRSDGQFVENVSYTFF